ETSEGRIEAANVVVATGPYQRPIIPRLLSNNATVFQVHANRYRGPGQLPSGAVLVIGSGASGVQIAEELLRAGREVYLSVGQHRRMPRRYPVAIGPRIGPDTCGETRARPFIAIGHRCLWRPHPRLPTAGRAGREAAGSPKSRT